jgi:hypothetical protein
MPRFVTARDYEFIQHITRELIDEWMDVPVVLYKILAASSRTNIYGESTAKSRYTPVRLDAIVKYDKNTEMAGDGFGPDQQQMAEFAFVRRLLEEVNAYPEIGDIIEYNNHFYEIHNKTETQLIAGKPQYNMAIICMTHLTRRTAIDIEEPQV